MVRAWPFEQLLKVVQCTLSGLPAPFAVDGGHEQALVLLLVLLLVGTIGGAFTSIFVLLHLAFDAIKDRSNHLLARGMAGDDVEELLGGSRALTS